MNNKQNKLLDSLNISRDDVLETGYLIHNENIVDVHIICLKFFDQKFSNITRNEKFEEQIGFRITNAKAFNTFLFTDAVDVVVCDKNNKVIATYSSMPVQKATSYYKNGWYIYVFAKKMIKFLNLGTNDYLTIGNYKYI
ncbi:hypothetical protein STIUS_v1c04070 [Spiroplasma sp. TIUS-1]|uniref:hypothetical protein n=1 Tax=Spiroplasma sp. TIUS-1 TaxID=216963 RepID=UPI00139772EC|nr:hypothetical protein [Spiroplasma sp. TIUS-1]QHX35961.1 hypothetical protein STIUS_v1c04070 [Spiroplasma sp. TIUS-1]